ncbi:hypothetical protein WISP_63128 [Willisornis vidua]|uniref:Uncharacterized protein n=1 Tax=Willisornis vidua TaxID=1566151 RepID=A0ABQ9DFY0_9PASS|nr:hypothetical protein WISP_63128 [Willisornis vidua]
MEKITLGDIDKHLKDNTVTGQSQHVFMRGTSCLSDLISFYGKSFHIRGAEFLDFGVLIYPSLVVFLPLYKPQVSSDRRVPVPVVICPHLMPPLQCYLNGGLAQSGEWECRSYISETGITVDMSSALPLPSQIVLQIFSCEIFLFMAPR